MISGAMPKITNETLPQRAVCAAMGQLTPSIMPDTPPKHERPPLGQFATSHRSGRQPQIDRF